MDKPPTDAQLLRGALEVSGVTRADLGDRLASEGFKLRKANIDLVAVGKRRLTSAEKEAIVRLLELPQRWFAENFWTEPQEAGEPNARLARLEQQLTEVRNLIVHNPGQMSELIGMSRRTKQAVAGPPAETEQETPAAASTRDEGDATSEAEQPRPEETPRTAEKPAR